MFDSVGAFTKQFTPIEGGYLFYPWKKSGGKLVTEHEYQLLVADWKRVAGTRGIWKIVGLIVVAILLWMFVSKALTLPEGADWVFTTGCVLGVSAWLLWMSFSPQRLVRHRPDIAPPRPASQVRREARALLNWPFVIAALVASGLVFLPHLLVPQATLGWWVWVTGSGLLFSCYLWIAFNKLRDRRR